MNIFHENMHEKLGIHQPILEYHSLTRPCTENVQSLLFFLLFSLVLMLRLTTQNIEFLVYIKSLTWFIHKCVSIKEPYFSSERCCILKSPYSAIRASSFSSGRGQYFSHLI
jgi:hypothetical protein